MNDIIDSLRKAERIELGIAEILRLRAEVATLRAALKPFADNYDVPRDGDLDMTEAYRAAAAALKETTDE